MAELGFEAHGVDVVPEAVDWARDNQRDSGLDARFRTGSVVDLKGYPDAYFDFVYDGDCLHCVIGPDRGTCLRNVHRVLKPGGLFRAKANCLNAEVEDRLDVAQDCWFDPNSQCLVRDGEPHYYLSRAGQLEAELEEAGFTILGKEQIDQFKDKEPFQSCWLNVDASRPPAL